MFERNERQTKNKGKIKFSNVMTSNIVQYGGDIYADERKNNNKCIRNERYLNPLNVILCWNDKRLQEDERIFRNCLPAKLKSERQLLRH